MSLFFFQAMLGLFSSCLAGLWILHSRCNDDISKIQEGVGSDWLDVRAHVWSIEIKTSLEKIYLFIELEKEQNESKDFFSDVLINRESKEKIKQHLDEIVEKYLDYKIIENSLISFKENNDLIKKWIRSSAIPCIITVIWALIGIIFVDSLLIEYIMNNIYVEAFWGLLVIILIILLICSYKLVISFNKKEKDRSLIEDKKIKYFNEMGENINV